MDAKPLEIGYLTNKKAWQLFVELAGDVVTNEEIKPLAGNHLSRVWLFAPSSYHCNIGHEGKDGN